MSKNGRNGEGLGRKLLALAILSALTVMSPVVTHAQKKSKADKKRRRKRKSRRSTTRISLAKSSGDRPYSVQGVVCE